MNICESYQLADPPFAVRPVVEALLSIVPAEYLVGLDRVVLTDTHSLNRDQRREKIRSGRRKRRITECTALYHYAARGHLPWIQIFVDNLVTGYRPLYFRLSFLRRVIVAQVLFHELGHHIGAIRQGLTHPDERSAEKWMYYLFSIYVASALRWLSFARPALRLLFLKPVRMMARRMSKHERH